MFKITCLICGASTEIVLINGSFVFKNDDVDIDVIDYDGQKQIKCNKCLNSIKEDW